MLVVYRCEECGEHTMAVPPKGRFEARPIEIAPLRQRKEEIAILPAHFLERGRVPGRLDAATRTGRSGPGRTCAGLGERIWTASEENPLVAVEMMGEIQERGLREGPTLPGLETLNAA